MSMRYRPGVLLILLYVTLDFANPMMPGAVMFNPDDTIEGVYVERVRPQSPAVAVALVPILGHGDLLPIIRAVARGLRENPEAPNRWRVQIGRAHSFSPDPASLTDDH